MKKLILCVHTTLDGFMAGKNGEMDWINVNEEIFNYAGKLTDEADTALYGRVTYQMMESDWPSAAEQPNATKHDIEHSKWYNRVAKVVLSNTLKSENLTNTTILNGDLTKQINKLKQGTEKDILIFGSPTAAHSLTAENLIDEYWLFVNPIVLGQGIPLFKNTDQKINLRLVEAKIFTSGVVGLHYQK